MYVNKDSLKRLMDEHAEGNYHKFAKMLGVEPAQLHRILNTESQAGALFLGKLMAFCEKQGIEFKEQIFLPTPFTAINEKLNTVNEGGMKSVM